MSDNNPDVAIKIRELTPSELSERARAYPCHKKPERIKTALEILKTEGYVPWQDLAEFTARKEEFIPAVLELFEKTSPDELERRMKFAGYLARMGVSAGHDFIIEHLHSPNKETRWLALLNWNVQDAPPRNKAEAALLLTLLHDEDPRIQRVTIQTCGGIKAEGLIPAFEKLLEDKYCSDRGRIAFILLSNEGAENRVDMVVNFLNRDSTSNDTYWALMSLHNLVRNGSPALSVKALTAIEIFFLHSPNKYKFIDMNVRMFSEIATARTLPTLKYIVENATRHGYAALDAIARLKPELALELLPSHLDHFSLSASFLRAFQTSASESDWAVLVKMVVDALAAKLKNFNFSDTMVDLLLDHGHELGRSVVEKEISSSWPTVRMHAMWKLNHWTIQDALQALKAHDLIEMLPDPSLIERVRMEQPSPVPDEYLLIEVLRAAKILRQVSSEADAEDRPPNHCDLLAEFSQATDGIFTPQFCRQIVIKKPVADPEFTAKLNQQRIAESLEPLPLDEEFNQVSFVVGNHLFEFETFVSHRYYDVGSVEMAVNAALEHLSAEKRLMRVDSKDGFNLFFFGKPEQVRQFCSAFAIIGPDDFNRS